MIESYRNNMQTKTNKIVCAVLQNKVLLVKVVLLHNENQQGTHSTPPKDNWDKRSFFDVSIATRGSKRVFQVGET